MKKVISAVAIAAVGIVSLAASPAHADERGEFCEHAPYAAPARPMPVPRATPVRYYRHERWEAERARERYLREERRALEERRAEFYAHWHNRWQRARFERWYADRCHDLDRGLRIDIGFGY